MKRTKLKAFCLGLAAVFALLQLVPADRSNPPAESDFDGPPEIRKIMVEKCYDCHSNEAKWPWYSYVAPVSWWIAKHVEEGRSELNFSSWGKYSSDRKEDKIGEIYDEILDGYMPPKSYLMMHPETKVTEAELALIEEWLDGNVE